MVKNQDKLKDALREILPIIEEFVQSDVVEDEDELFDGLEPVMDASEYDEDSEGSEIDEIYGDKPECPEDNKAARKKMSAMLITKKMGKGKNRK